MKKKQKEETMTRLRSGGRRFGGAIAGTDATPRRTACICPSVLGTFAVGWVIVWSDIEIHHIFVSCRRNIAFTNAVWIVTHRTVLFRAEVDKIIRTSADVGWPLFIANLFVHGVCDYHERNHKQDECQCQYNSLEIHCFTSRSIQYE